MSLDKVTDLSAHQRLADRGFQGDLSFLEVHLVGTDYSVAHLPPGGHVRELDLAEKGHPVLGLEPMEF